LDGVEVERRLHAAHLEAAAVGTAELVGQHRDLQAQQHLHGTLGQAAAFRQDAAGGSLRQVGCHLTGLRECGLGLACDHTAPVVEPLHGSGLGLDGGGDSGPAACPAQGFGWPIRSIALSTTAAASVPASVLSTGSLVAISSAPRAPAAAKVSS